MKLVLVWCSLGLVHLTLYAQQLPYKFKNYSVEEGLSQSTVYAITQDSSGFIWVGTRDGLNRFDGRSFMIYQPQDRRNSLSERTVRALSKGNNNMLWLGTDGGGVAHFDPLSETFTNVCSIISVQNCNPELNVLSLVYEDSVLWAGLRERGIIRFDLKNGEQKEFLEGETVWALSTGEEDAIYAGTDGGLVRIQHEREELIYRKAVVYTLFHNNTSGNIWIGTEYDGVKILDTKIDELMEISSLNSLKQFTIQAIEMDANSDIWFGTGDSGVFVYKQEDEVLKRITSDESDRQSISENSIRSLFIDRGGVIWIGTNTSGISNYSFGRFLFPHYSQNSTQGNISGNVVLSFAELNARQIMVGTERNGLNVFDTEAKISTPVDFLTETTIVSLLNDSKNRLWIGSDGEGLFVFEPENVPGFRHPQKIEGISDEAVLTLLEIGQNEFLAGTYRGLNWIEDGRVVRQAFAQPGKEGALQGDRVLALHKEKNGNFWVGTYAGGLSYYLSEEDKFITYKHAPGWEGSISSNRVQAIYKDSKGRLWIGTYDGLNLFNDRNGTFKVFNKTDGLPSEVIYGILEDKEGNLWLSTNQGLSYFNPETNTFTNFTTADGLQSAEFNGGAYFKASKGQMYFGGINGFNVFNPQTLAQNTHVPNTVVTSFMVEGNRIPLNSGEYTFNYQDSYFLFEFASLDFNKPEKQVFRYKLIGLDDRWVNIGMSRSVNFSGLPPGTYELIVQGTNGDSIWGNASKPIVFSINPPLWETHFFRASLFILFIGLLYVAFKYRTFYLLKEERTRNRIARDLHDDLSATLSSISFFSEAAKRVTNEREEDTIRYLRIINESAVEAKEKINDIIWAIDPSKDNWPVFLKKCKRFAADALDSKEIEYQLDFADDINIPLTLEFRQNLWLIFKEAINNLIRYSDATKVKIQLAKKDDSIVLDISDNGKGFDVEKTSEGHGIKNMQYRAEQINGTADLQTALGEGTKWHFEFEV